MQYPQLVQISQQVFLIYFKKKPTIQCYCTELPAQHPAWWKLGFPFPFILKAINWSSIMRLFYRVVNKKWCLSQFPHGGFIIIENVYNKSLVLVHTCNISYSLRDWETPHIAITFILAAQISCLATISKPKNVLNILLFILSKGGGEWWLSGYHICLSPLGLGVWFSNKVCVHWAYICALEV